MSSGGHHALAPSRRDGPTRRARGTRNNGRGMPSPACEKNLSPRERDSMSLDGDVTRCLQRLKGGDRSAAQDLLQRYYAQLVRLAQTRLRGSVRRAVDGEDVALSAFKSFCLRAEGGGFPRLDDSDDLWQVLVTI